MEIGNWFSFINSDHWLHSTDYNYCKLLIVEISIYFYINGFQ